MTEPCAACEALDEPGNEGCPCGCHIDDEPRRVSPSLALRGQQQQGREKQ